MNMCFYENENIFRMSRTDLCLAKINARAFYWYLCLANCQSFKKKFIHLNKNKTNDNNKN